MPLRTFTPFVDAINNRAEEAEWPVYSVSIYATIYHSVSGWTSNGPALSTHTHIHTSKPHREMSATLGCLHSSPRSACETNFELKTTTTTHKTPHASVASAHDAHDAQPTSSFRSEAAENTGVLAPFNVPRLRRRQLVCSRLASVRRNAHKH